LIRKSDKIVLTLGEYLHSVKGARRVKTAKERKIEAKTFPYGGNLAEHWGKSV
jgi:hypothetical protein